MYVRPKGKFCTKQNMTEDLSTNLVSYSVKPKVLVFGSLLLFQVWMSLFLFYSKRSR